MVKNSLDWYECFCLATQKAKIQKISDKFVSKIKSIIHYVTDWKNSPTFNRGQIPIKAHCSLPDGVTKVGNEIEIEISHCGSQDSFTHEINYDSITFDQIIALIQSSTECYQKIEYDCLSTPLAVSVSNSAIYIPMFIFASIFWPTL